MNSAPLAAHNRPATTPPMNAALSHTRVFGTKLYRKVNTPVTNRNGPMTPNARTMLPKGSCSVSQRMEAWLPSAPNRLKTMTMNTGPDDHQAQVLADASHDRARALDVPGEVEGLLELLDGRDHGVEQEGEADRPEHVAAHVVDECHELRRQLGRPHADRAQELVDQRLEVAVHAKALQDRECEGGEGNEREQRRVDESHGAQVQLAGQQVADQREGVAQDVEQPVRGLDREMVAVEQQALDAFVQHGRTGSSRQRGTGPLGPQLRAC